MAKERRPTLAIRIRSVLFYVLSLLMAVPLLPLLPGLILPQRATLAVIDSYLRAQLFLLRVVCGVRYKVEGLSNLPDAGCLIASQHESSWETLYFQVLLGQPAMFAKKEVFAYPLIGLLARKIGHIPVDRKGSLDAMRQGFLTGRDLAAAGRKLLIFPTGTRSVSGKAPIQSGIGALYQLVDMPVVPVLLNSGHCWPSGRFLKYPGMISVRVLPAIPKGMERREFLDQLSHELGQSL